MSYQSGYPFRFIGASGCQFHLATIVRGWAISTVGHYTPPDCKNMEPIGGGRDDYFELAIRPCRGVDKNLIPVFKGDEWEIVERFADSRDAERAHHRACALAEEYGHPVPRTELGQ